jgi:hypothetical protein
MSTSTIISNFRSHATLFFYCRVVAFGSQDLGFRTQTDGRTAGYQRGGGKEKRKKKKENLLLQHFTHPNKHINIVGLSFSVVATVALRTWVSRP